MSSPGIAARARTALAFVTLAGFTSAFSPPSAFATDNGVPASVLRVRGGLAVPDPDQEPGPGWCAGGSAGLALNRDVLLSLSYDHLALNQRLWSSGRRALDPVTLELELGRPTEHRATLRLAAGAGLYFHRDSFIEYLPYYTQRHNSLGSTFGMHFGGGFSIPLWSRTLMDLDYRYHQTVGRESALVISTISAGLRFLFPGREPDPEGYVRAGGREAATYAASETAP